MFLCEHAMDLCDFNRRYVPLLRSTQLIKFLQAEQGAFQNYSKLTPYAYMQDDTIMSGNLVSKEHVRL